MILLLTNLQDFGADYTILRMEERGVRFLRLNSEDIGRYRFVHEVRGGRVARRLRSDEGDFDLDEVTAVWLRRQIQPNPTWVAVNHRSYAAAEWRFFLEGVTAALDARWMNAPSATFLAERKVYVLERAMRLAFSIPDTLASNDPLAAARFLESCDACVAKPVYQGLYAADDGCYAINTRRLDGVALSHGAIEVVPFVLQREVVRGRDLRLTFVGEVAFGAAVEWDARAEVDWRTPGAQPRFVPYEIPVELARRCRNLMADLGLLYGAIDLIESNDGKIWFLEVNPAGEFAWLEVQLGMRIRDALIDVLTDAR